MRRPVLGTLFALACVSILFLPATTSAIPLHVKEKVPIEVPQVHVIGTDPLVGEVETTKIVERIVHVAPADTDDDGCRDSRDSWDGPGCEAPPPPPEPAPEPEPVATESVAPATEPAYSSGGYAIPSYIVECESGGDYTAQNPSGAYGAYQIMPGTADAYGCDLSTPAGQDACAAEIYATEGSSPWVCG